MAHHKCDQAKWAPYTLPWFCKGMRSVISIWEGILARFCPNPASIHKKTRGRKETWFAGKTDRERTALPRIKVAFRSLFYPVQLQKIRQQRHPRPMQTLPNRSADYSAEDSLLHSRWYLPKYLPLRLQRLALPIKQSEQPCLQIIASLVIGGTNLRFIPVQDNRPPVGKKFHCRSFFYRRKKN